MRKLFLSILFPVLGFAQTNYPGVCINCTNPSEAMDVDGRIKARTIDLVTSAEYILVTNADGVHKKILLSSLSQNSGTCPNFIRNQSNGHFLLFASPSSIPNPNNSLVIQGKTFVSAGTYIQNNTYYFSYSNTTGVALNINNPFSVSFGNLICNY